MTLIELLTSPVPDRGRSAGLKLPPSSMSIVKSSMKSIVMLLFGSSDRFTSLPALSRELTLNSYSPLEEIGTSTDHLPLALTFVLYSTPFTVTVMSAFGSPKPVTLVFVQLPWSSSTFSTSSRLITSLVVSMMIVPRFSALRPDFSQ